ncbi:MAG: type IV pilus biogenesis protein PilP [Acidiferrobacterales bacterium]
MRKTVFSALTVAMVIGCGIGVADATSGNAPTGGTSVPTPTVSVGQLGRLQTEAALLQAKLKIAKLKAAITKASAPANSSGSPSGVSTVLPSSITQAPPTVESLYGQGKEMEAVLDYANGGTISVRTGSTLPGGGRVIRVSPSGVVIEQQGTRETLVFSTAPPASANPMAPQNIGSSPVMAGPPPGVNP